MVALNLSRVFAVALIATVVLQTGQAATAPSVAAAAHLERRGFPPATSSHNSQLALHRRSLFKLLADKFAKFKQGVKTDRENRRRWSQLRRERYEDQGL